MGFDLRGFKPNNEPLPDEPAWLEQGDRAEEARKAYISWQQNTPGAYFRNEVWYWRTLWDFVCEVCDDILTEEDMEEGMGWSGHVISKTKAKKIAARLRKVDKDLEDHQIDHERRMNNLPDEECDLCGGTGKRKDPLDEEKFSVFKSGPVREIHCDDCNGKGITRPFITKYHFKADNVRTFAEFCEYSGGFTIG